MDFALIVEEASNSARTRARLKRRWPLRTVEVLVPAASATVARRAAKIMRLLCNVKEVEVLTSAAKFPASFLLKPNASRVGALFKERTGELLAALKPLEGGEAIRAHNSGRALKAGGVEVPLSAFDLSTIPREGFEVAEKGGVFVAIRKERDSRLVAEGLMRDVARRLQALRKEKGFVPTAMLGSASVAGLEPEDLALLDPMKEEIAFLVRVRRVALSYEKGEGRGWHQSDLDGRPIYLKVG